MLLDPFRLVSVKIQPKMGFISEDELSMHIAIRFQSLPKLCSVDRSLPMLPKFDNFVSNAIIQPEMSL